MLTVGQVQSPVTFAANGEYFVSGGTDGVRVWRMEDGELMATIKAEHVQCVAFSQDGKRIAAGTYNGDVMVLDAKIYKHKCTTWQTNDVIRGIDISPDSTRLVVFGDHTATVWDIATRERCVGPLRHEDYVLAAKYSPEGDRIATATRKSVRVYDVADGRLLVDVSVNVAPWYNTGLLWFNDHLLVMSDSGIKQMDASTGSQIWEWPVPSVSNPVCIAIPKHGQLIAYSANCTESRITVSIISFNWIIACLNKFLVLIHFSTLLSPLYPIPGARYPDQRCCAQFLEERSARGSGKVTVDYNTPVVSPCTRWSGPSPGTLGTMGRSDCRCRKCICRSVRALALILIYTKSIAFQPSIMGYIAKSVSLVRKGKKHEAYRACDIAFEHLHSAHASFLLLIKVSITGTWSPISCSC